MTANVVLHIYDLNPDANKALRLLGTGAFHSAVEVFGEEWSYGFRESGTGIFCCPPKSCQGAVYRESVKMGTTPMSQHEVDSLLERMRTEWRGMEYDLLRRNCCVFSNAFCQELGVGSIPNWVTNLAAAGATLGDGFIKAASVTHSAAIIAAAKAGEINAKYQITGTAQARAQDFIVAMQGLEKQVQGLDQQYQLRQKAQGVAVQVVTQAGQLDRQYGITQKAQDAASRVSMQADQLDRQYRIQENVTNFASTATVQVVSAVQSLARQSVAASQAASQAASRPPPRQGGQQASTNASGGQQDCVCF